MEIKIELIGIINSLFKSEEKCPVQPEYSKEALVTVELFPEYEQGIQDINTLILFFISIYCISLIGPVI